jgi:hypothetical protein
MYTGCAGSTSRTDFSAVCLGSTVRNGSGFGPAGIRPKYVSTIGTTSSGLTSPTIAMVMFTGT